MLLLEKLRTAYITVHFQVILWDTTMDVPLMLETKTLTLVLNVLKAVGGIYGGFIYMKICMVSLFRSIDVEKNQNTRNIYVNHNNFKQLRQVNSL